MKLPEISISSDILGACQVARIEEQVADCLRECISVVNLTFPDNAELSLLITTDNKVQALNRKWRGIDKPTNVLSFPGADIKPGDSAGDILGDIVISMETVRREAALENKTENQHFSHLVIHGFLHLFGYDHETEPEAELMEGLETETLSRMGIPDPHASLELP